MTSFLRSLVAVGLVGAFSVVGVACSDDEDSGSSSSSSGSTVSSSSGGASSGGTSSSGGSSSGGSSSSSSSSSSGSCSGDNDAGLQTITDIVVANESFSTLEQAVIAADLADTLAGAGPFTVFAPTNAAFAKIPEATLTALLADQPALQNVLLYHVVSGTGATKAQVAELAGEDGTVDLTMAQEGTVTVTVNEDATVTLTDELGNDTVIETFDIAASNGVIHVLGDVLLPAAD